MRATPNLSAYLLAALTASLVGCVAGHGPSGDSAHRARPTTDAGIAPTPDDTAPPRSDDAGQRSDSESGQDVVGSSEDARVDPEPDPRDPLAIRIYVAGESIEAFNRFDAPPFDATGALIGPADNSAAEYGWMVPFAERLRLRHPGVSVTWVGAKPWIDHSWETSDGAYPAAPGLTSAIGGTTVAQWIEYAGEQLEQREYCYDVAFAARGGNDNADDVGEAEYKARMLELIALLDAGSSCREHPLIIAVAHMPDSGGWSWEMDAGSVDAWMTRQHTRYVQWTQDVVAEATSWPGSNVRYVDLFTPFVQEQATTAFPSPSWMDGAAVALDVVHVDGQHPRRLASIYAGEIAADAFELIAVPTH